MDFAQDSNGTPLSSTLPAGASDGMGKATEAQVGAVKKLMSKEHFIAFSLLALIFLIIVGLVWLGIYPQGQRGSQSSTGSPSATPPAGLGAMQNAALADICNSDLDCTDSQKSTKDSCVFSDEEKRKICKSEPITSCISGDNYCPEGCTTQDDDDCIIVNHCHVNSDCDDRDWCTIDKCGATSGGCDFAKITVCRNGDKCCPQGCTPKADSDCVGVLPDLVLLSQSSYFSVVDNSYHVRLELVNEGMGPVDAEVDACLLKDDSCLGSVVVNLDQQGQVRRLRPKSDVLFEVRVPEQYAVQAVSGGDTLRGSLSFAIDRSELSSHNNRYIELNEDNNVLSISLDAGIACRESLSAADASGGRTRECISSDGTRMTSKCASERYLETCECGYDGPVRKEGVCLSSAPCVVDRCSAGSSTGENEGAVIDEENMAGGPRTLILVKSAEPKAGTESAGADTVVENGQKACSADNECPGGSCVGGFCKSTTGPIKKMLSFLIALFS